MKTNYLLSLLSCGYVPLSRADPSVIAEAIRQAESGMVQCLCSNCDPAAADRFLRCQVDLTSSNFSELVLDRNPNVQTFDRTGCDPMILSNYPDFERPQIDPYHDWFPRDQASLPQNDPAAHISDFPNLQPISISNPRRLDLCFIRLYLKLQQALTRLFDTEYPNGNYYKLNDLFGSEQLWCLVVHFQSFLDGTDLDYVFGSEPLPNSYHVILSHLTMWRSSRDSIAILHPSKGELLYQEQQRNQAVQASKTKHPSKLVASAKDNVQVSDPCS